MDDPSRALEELATDIRPVQGSTADHAAQCKARLEAMADS